MFTEPGPGQPSQGGYGGGAGVVGAAIQTGGMLYDSYQNRKLSRENTNKTLAANKREAELAYQRQVEERNYMNMYNTPQSQMQRFLEAGLNPHLIYGRGNEGNQSFTPQYQPARQEYNYQPMQIGGALGSILPTLMAVGTWMQNMRLSEAELKQKETGTIKVETDTERQRQLIEYLKSANPEMVEALQRKNLLLDTQVQAGSVNVERAKGQLQELSAQMRLKYGDEWWKSTNVPGSAVEIGGKEKLKYLQEIAATKLKEAQASWSEFDITNPQQIMMMVLQGVMGMAGAQMRLSKGGKSAAPIKSQKARPRGVVKRSQEGRGMHPARRVQRGD